MVFEFGTLELGLNEIFLGLNRIDFLEFLEFLGFFKDF
jgi:hypothetical protein